MRRLGSRRPKGMSLNEAAAELKREATPPDLRGGAAES